MTQYKIKIFEQTTKKCYKVLSCDNHILQEVKEEYPRVIEEVDLPDGDYFSQLYRILNGEDILVKNGHEYVLVCKNHKAKIS